MYHGGKQTLFYLTQPSPCPYLAGQVEQKIFTRLSGDADPDFLLASSLNQKGFRRSQGMLYRPACPTCLACVPIRIVVKDFKPGASLRRTVRKNLDLHCTQRPPGDCADYFPLFRSYQQSRHADSDMVDMDFADYENMMKEGTSASFFLVLESPQGTPLAVMLADRLKGALSAVYSFYAPEEDKRSLGTELILRLVGMARAERLDHVYLGYWIRDCRKMNYKSRFPALQRLGANGWEVF